ncbi:MAG: tetratricopeptide repeat protein [Planctomycetes bacterium]|nr:tetratricopeptide repeat protein [Planctomycetota bacterium]
MKRTERHQLKENEVALVVAQVKETLETYKREVTAGLVAIAIGIAALSGYLYWRQHVDQASRTLLADAMAVAGASVVPPSPPAPPAVPGTPPTPATPATPAAPPPGSFPSEQAKLDAALTKFMAAANTYPSTTAGIAARYEAAATLAALGRIPEAIRRYQEVIDRASTSIYADTARLGLADAQVRAGQFDAAIAGYKALASAADGKMPLDGVLMQLGRACAAAGKAGDARLAFQRIVDEFPQSSYAALARKELDSAKTTG